VKQKLRIVSLLLTVVLLMSAFVTPVAAGRENDRGRGEERGRGRQSAQQIQYLDAEIQVIDGQPVIKYETAEGYSFFEFPWPELGIVDGKELTLVRQDDSFVMQTADGYEKIHIEEFEVALSSGNLVLVARVNPLKLIPIAVVTAALTAAGIKISKTTLAIATSLILSGTAVNLANVKSQFATRLVTAAQKIGIILRAPSNHALQQAIDRGVSIDDIITVMTSGQRFFDPKHNTRIAFHSGLRMFVAIDQNVNRLVTVANNAGRKDRWKPQNWNW